MQCVSSAEFLHRRQMGLAYEKLVVICGLRFGHVADCMVVIAAQVDDLFARPLQFIERERYIFQSGSFLNECMYLFAFACPKSDIIRQYGRARDYLG